MDAKELIARRIARELKDGFYVNLGIGLPTMIPAFVPPGIDVILQSENGLLGIGPPPSPDQEDPDLINAGKQPVTTLPGFKFLLERSGLCDDSRRAHEHEHSGRDASLLPGRPCNWTIPGKMVKGMGGAMDLSPAQLASLSRWSTMPEMDRL